MIDKFLSGYQDYDIWLTCKSDGRAIGFCYAVPEKLTEGTWNMLAIAIHPDCQGKGVGSAIVQHLESTLRERGQRILIADTSGTEEFEPIRKFYQSKGYLKEARIRDFWAKGNDKIVFWKLIEDTI